MNVLVTGGAGFIGSHLVEKLLARGDRVTVVDDFNDYYDPALKRANLTAARGNPGFSLVECDICDAALIERVFKAGRPDVVVHLAARAGVRPSLADPLLYERVNLGGTVVLLEACRKHGVKRFVFASSSSVYGNNKVPFREDDPVRPLSPYGATKAAGEVICRTYRDLYGISCNALRFFTVYGARQRPDMAIHKFTRLISEGKKIPYFGNGETRRDYTYYTDIIEGVTAAVDRDLGYEVFNLGEARTTSLRELVAMISSALGKEASLDKLPPQPGDVEETCADVSKARRMLDYRPSVEVAEGVRLFVEWFRLQRVDRITG